MLEKPFYFGQDAFYCHFGSNGEILKTINCIILDGFYQEKTRDRREGWRVLIEYKKPLWGNRYTERYLDELTIIN